MKQLFSLLAILLLSPLASYAGNISGLDRKNFNKYRKVESESPDYKLNFSGDTKSVWPNHTAFVKGETLKPGIKP